MSTMSRLIARIARLPPAETYDVGVEKDLAIPMPDGVTLLADHYFPRNLGPRPTVMTRSVYADRTKGTWAIELYAERGFHVLVVSGRGTLGSGGELNPFRQEHDDGLPVLARLRQQPWFTGVLGTAGASYLGYTQWAIARDAGSMVGIGRPQRQCRRSISAQSPGRWLVRFHAAVLAQRLLGAGCGGPEAVSDDRPVVAYRCSGVDDGSPRGADLAARAPARRSTWPA